MTGKDDCFMNAATFLCVDGGGTKTEALLADTKGHVLGRGLAGGSNALSVGVERATAAVTDAMRGALGCHPMDDVSAAWLFIPGFSQCLPLPLPMPVYLSGDAANAYFGALGRPGGIVLLTGTGSFAVHIDEDGKETSVGGWGPMLGDEGSGYDIGRRAVIHALSRFDRGSEPTNLGKAVIDYYGAGDASRLVHVIYHDGCDRERMAMLCRVVGAMATEGDADANHVLADACQALAALARTLKERLCLSDPLVSVTGGVTRMGDAFISPLAAAIEEQGLAFVPPLYNPAVGGALYACWRVTGEIPDRALADMYFSDYLRIKEREQTC